MNIKLFRIILISINKSNLSSLQKTKRGAARRGNDPRKPENIVWNKGKQQYRRKDYCHHSFGKLDVK